MIIIAAVIFAVAFGFYYSPIVMGIIVAAVWAWLIALEIRDRRNGSMP